MPRLNGIETCRRLRSDPATAEATIVMLTGDSGDIAERGAQDAGADLFLTKPFSPLHLLRLVDRIGARRVEARPPRRLLGTRADGAQQQLELVLEAERLGYDSVWTAEAYGSDAATILAWLAQATSTIRLGSAIFQMPGRARR